MKYIYLLAASLLLLACQNETAIKSNESAEEVTVVNGQNSGQVALSGNVTITAEPLVSEDAACIIPIQIRNGTEAEVSVSMFGFSVTGAGDDDTGNMFPQDVPSGEYRTARIIQIGQNCDAFDAITTKDVLCKTGDAPCEVEFEDSPEIAFSTAE